MGRISRAEEKREQIIWALHDLLSERGHQTITTKDIARRAGVPYGVIHYYFRSKAEIYSYLVKAIQKHFDGLWAERQKEKQGKHSVTNGLKDIEFMVDNFILNSTFGRVFYNLFHMGFEDETIRTALLDMYRHYHAELTRVFTIDGAGEKSRSTASLVQALVEGLTILRAIDKDAADRESALRLLNWATESYLSEPVKQNSQ